jgi:hypothetical protein
MKIVDKERERDSSILDWQSGTDHRFTIYGDGRLEKVKQVVLTIVEDGR